MHALNIPQPNLAHKLYLHEVNFSYPSQSLNPAVILAKRVISGAFFLLTRSFHMINANYNDSSPISCVQM